MRAVASCPVPIVSAVGHEQDTPLCDLAADVRASTPTAAGRLVVPDLDELLERLGRLALRCSGRCARARARAQRLGMRGALDRAPAIMLERKRAPLVHARSRLDRAPALVLERKRARSSTREAASARCRRARRSRAVTRSSAAATASSRRRRPAGAHVDVEVADGAFGATVD